jgi:tetratricopeptide (TPR) repeat protein
MKNITTIVVLSVIFLSIKTQAQNLKIPQPSTLQKIEQDFGLGQITITYSRPNVKGRKIFGGMEPYGKVWRTGANAATKIKLTDSVLVEQHALAPGEYGLFTIPGANEWTVIFNKIANQWGAYSYDSTQDVLRFKIKSGKLDKNLETFTMQFANCSVDRCELQLLWEKTSLSIHFETDVDAHVMANIDELMKGEKKPYYFAAIYYYNHDKDMNKALAWINEFEKANPKADNAKYWKARIQLKMGDKAGAIATATEGVKMATEDADVEYIRLNKEVLADAGKQ